MQIVKKTLSIIQIVGPILLLISTAIKLTQLMSNPDNKKLLPKLRNSFIAAALLFFIPTIVNVGMGMLDNSYNISACWNETLEQNYKTPNYIDPSGTNDSDKKNPIVNPGDYQKGTPKPSPSDDGNNTNGQKPWDDGDGNNGGNNGGDNGGDGNSGGLPSTPQGDISGDLQVHFINPNSRVDAIYIKHGNQSMFIDGGFKGDGTREIAYLDKIGVTHIDYYLGTHSHKNHVEAAPKIIQKYGIKKVITGYNTCNGSGSTPCTWYAIKGFANEQKVGLDGVTSTTFKPGDVFYLGGAKITCLGPLSVNNNLDKGVTAQNYNSIIMRLDYGTTSFLLTGDNSSSSNMKAINDKYPGMLNVDVLKNPHHNGCNSSSVYQMVNAEYIVFLTRYDYLPTSSCINTMKKYGAKSYFIVANGKSGNVLFTSDGTKINAYEHYKD